MTAKRFVPRAPTFFKATSKVNPAKGLDINSMQSVVGFLPQTGIKESGRATEDLKQQEDSGAIEHRSFIPLKQARAGGSYRRRVVNKYRLAAIKSLIKDSKNSTAATNAGKFFSTAQHAGKGGFVIGTKKNSKGNRFLLRINSIVKRNGKTVVKSTPIYAVKTNRSVRVKRTKFMHKASVMSAVKTEGFYIKEAEKQIAKL